MSERDNNEARENNAEARQKVDESEERAMSVFTSERKEDVIAIIIAFAFAIFALLVYGVSG